ncbi:MAG: PepSY-associated TM helix domain-containing protein, partial [Bacteroidota bacterium]
WLGLNIGMMLFVICFSGTFATLSNELDWLLNPTLRVEGKEAPYAWEAMYQNAQAAFPDLRITNLAQQKNSFTETGDYFASTAFVRHPEKGTLKVHLDPYTGEVLGYNPFLDVQRFFRSYHNNFFDGIRGELVVVFFAFFLLFSVLTGFIFYKNWFKNLFRLRREKGWRVFIADAHRMAGVWSLLFALIIALTGIWYLAENIFVATDRSILRFPTPEKISEAEVQQLGDTPEMISLDVAVQNAEKAFGDYQVQDIRLPSQPNGYIVMSGQDSNPLTRDRTNKVHVHPYTGAVVFIQRASDLTTVNFINNIVDTLHFGTFGGLGVKILWFVFGLILSVSILAGTYIWYLRHTKKIESQLARQAVKAKRKKTVQRTAPNPQQMGFSWRYLTAGRGAIISMSIILYYLIGTGIATVTNGFRIWSGHPKGYVATVDSTQLGTWPVALDCTYPCTLAEGTKLTARFQTSGIPNYKSLHLGVQTAAEDTLHLPFKGSAATPSLTLDSTFTNNKIARLALVAKSHSAQIHRHPVSVEKMESIAAAMTTQFPTKPERTYADVPTFVYVIAGLFTLLTGGIVLIWTVFVVRATWQEQQLMVIS